MSFLYVKAYHGVCTTHNRKIHKPQYLTGLRDRLQRLGYRVDLIPVKFDNLCLLQMCGYEVFRCQIYNLQFNTPYERDTVCQKAVEAVIQASVKFRRTRAYLWFWTLLDDQLYKRLHYAPKDFWPKDVIFESRDNTTCLECIDCCHHQIKEREDN